MNNRKIYAFLIFIIYIIFSPTVVFAAQSATKPDVSVSGRKGSHTTTCTSWLRPGAGTCKVTVKIAKSGACNGATKDFTIKKNDTYVHNITIASNSSTASSSTHCNAVVTIKSWNFETDPPYWGSMIASVSGAKCTTGSFNAGGNRNKMPEITCASAPKITMSGLKDDKAGVSYTSKTVSCALDSDCWIVATDKIGNTQDIGMSQVSKRPGRVHVNKDRTPCSSTSISITSGLYHHGYYAGTVTCQAKCLADNLQTGSSGTGPSYGQSTTCSATTQDYAGNKTTRTITVPRDFKAPTCGNPSVSSDGISNGYRLGRVTVKWNATENGFGFNSSGSLNTTYTQSTTDNTRTSLGQTATDYVGNSSTCKTATWSRDTTAPSGCDYSFDNHTTQIPSTDSKIAVVENTKFSNSSVHATAWCTSDGQSGCSNTRHNKDYTSNGTHSGNDGIGVYDLTEHYNATPKNVKMCSINVTLIDKSAPSCTATKTVSNPKLSDDKTKWTNMTWHNNQAKVYDVNGNVEKTNSNQYVQAYLDTSWDNATSGGNISDIKSGFKSKTAMNSLADEARTTKTDGTENGIYTVFVRDKVYNTVNNSSRSGWSGSTLYAHGVNTTGNVGTCSTYVYSFDNTKPVAHIKLSDKTVAGNYDVWDNNSKITMSAKTVNNNTNSVKHWSSVDVYFKIWGTDPNGGKSYTGNEFQGRSGIKKVCYRLTQNSNHANTSWTCYEPNDQRDGSYGARSAEYSVPANTFTGITTIEVKVQDWAGNWSDVNNSQKVYIDTTRPTAKSDSTTSKNGFTEVVGTQNYNSMKNPIYPTQTGLDRPWVSQFVNSTFKGQDNTKNQYSGSYQFGYYWSTVEYNVQYADNQPYLVRADNSSRVNLSWNYFGTKTNANDKAAGVKVGTNTEFTLPTISNPAKTDYYWLYVRACDNVEIGPRNCQIYKSKLVRFDNDQPSIDSILDVTNNESDTVAESAADGHGWTNKLKLKIKTSDKPVDNERSQVAYISYKWNTNYDSKDDDKNSATFDSKNTAYTDASTPTASLSESDWTYVKCSAQDSDANLCTTTIDFNKFVKGTSPVHEGYRFLKVAIVDKAGNVSGDNGIVYGPYKFDITPPEITGLEFRGHRADNNAEINYNK